MGCVWVAPDASEVTMPANHSLRQSPDGPALALGKRAARWRIGSVIAQKHQMNIRKSPHTQSEQNISFEQTDLDPDLVRRLAGGDESELPPESAGGQIGGTRSPKRAPRPGPEHKTEPPVAAFEGSIKTRTVRDPDKQGISSRSSHEENRGQRKVVKSRDDAKAGVSHSGRKRAA